MIRKYSALFIASAFISQQVFSIEKFSLESRQGAAPEIRGPIPHQQLTQNSSEKIYKKLLGWAVALPHVSERNSQNSFPSARGLFINRRIEIDYRVDREFAHIHRVPGPGSMHLKMLTEDIEYIVEKGWGIYHPISADVAGKKGKVAVIMIFAPRNERDLVQIKKIVLRAYNFALKRR